MCVCVCKLRWELIAHEWDPKNYQKRRPTPNKYQVITIKYSQEIYFTCKIIITLALTLLGSE